MNINDDQVNSIIRSVLKLGAGFLTIHGAAQLGTAINTTNTAEAISGVVLALLAMYGSHRNNSAAPATTIATTTTPPAVAGVINKQGV